MPSTIEPEPSPGIGSTKSLRDRIRCFIEGLIEEELAAALGAVRTPASPPPRWRPVIIIICILITIITLLIIFAASRQYVTDTITEFMAHLRWFLVSFIVLLMLLVFLAPDWVEDRIGFLTFVAALVTAWGVFKASNDAETQRFNTAWMLVNSSPQTEHLSANGGQGDGGGRNEALAYLGGYHKSLQGADLSQLNGGGRNEALAYLGGYHKSLQGADLSEAILSYAHLNGMDLNRADMMYTDLFASELRAASLWSAIMTNSNLQFATLQGADLTRAKLQCADLRGAHLESLGVSEYVEDQSKQDCSIEACLPFFKSTDEQIKDMVRNEWVSTQWGYPAGSSTCLKSIQACLGFIKSNPEQSEGQALSSAMTTGMSPPI